MIAWIRNWLRRGSAAAPGLHGLLLERSRLDELMASYREFGFETLIPDCRRRRAAVERRIREFKAV